MHESLSDDVAGERFVYGLGELAHDREFYPHAGLAAPEAQDALAIRPAPVLSATLPLSAASCPEATAAGIIEQVIADADRDRWFTAQQALEYGLVDQVIKSAREAADDGRPARKKD